VKPTTEDHAAVIRFSIVVCSRNPRADYFVRVLEAIRGQSLDPDQWELLIIDSNSSPPLQDQAMPWLPATRFTRVEEPGVLRARMAGVYAAKGEWLVFVDDDNVLDPDYLEQAARVIARKPEIALFCGRISADFEQPPPKWLKSMYRQLAIIDFSSDSWAHEWDPDRVPCWTAGMCIRRDVAKQHFDSFADDPMAAVVMNRCEDVQLVMSTVESGHLAGLFTTLHMRHLIPPDRMTVGYLKRISCETAYIMTRLRCDAAGVGIRDFLRPLKNALVAVRFGAGPRGQVSLATAWAEFRGVLAAWRVADELGLVNDTSNNKRPAC
jgi:glycosyltransferase involved in cell wall biosynthesis